MTLKTRVFFLTTLLCSAILSSCNFPLIKSSQDGVDDSQSDLQMTDVSILATSVAQTLSAFESQIEQQATTEPESAALSTSTPSEENNRNQGLNQPLAQNYSYAASTVSETIYDNTVMDPEEDFTKTWTLLNSGTCSWYSGYQLVHVSGYQMGGKSPQFISKEITTRRIRYIFYRYGSAFIKRHLYRQLGITNI